MITSNQEVYSTPWFQVLSQDDKSQIFSAALEILERTGVKIQHEEALSLLKSAGARIKDQIAHIPPFLVQDALQSAPKKILIYSRDGQLAMRLEGRNSYYGTGSDTPDISDPEGNFRKYTREDIGKVGVVVDALDNLDFIMSLGLISDEPVQVTDLYQFQEMLFNTCKPIVFTSHDRRGNADIIQMAEIAVGGKEKLRSKPFIIHYIEPSSPLRHSKEAADKLLLCAKERIPVIYTPCPSCGGTSPITLAGTIALTLAEGLSGVVVSQLKGKGAPVIIGGVISMLDMKTTAYLYGSPEFHLMSAGLAEMCQFIDMPMFGTAGCSDSPLTDEQAAIESTLSIATQSLSGANLIHDVGYLGSGLVSSLEMVVMSDEIISMTKRIMRGIDTDDERLALELINEVGPGGSFLSKRHTLENFRTEHWQPNLINRSNYEKWADKGGKSMGERVNDRTKEILAEHNPKPLEENRQKEILKIIDKERESREVRY